MSDGYGGSNTGYAWWISTNNSGASINASTGAYTAGATGKVADTLSVIDSLGNTASVNVSVGGGLAINPPSPQVAPLGSVPFSVVGGSGTNYTWALAANASGGSIEALAGTYTAGRTDNVADTVQVTDSLGNVATVVVTVTGSNGDGGVNDGGGPAGGVVASGGCGCTIVDEPTAPRSALALLVVAAFLCFRRRTDAPYR